MVTPLIPFRVVIHLRQVHMGNFVISSSKAFSFFYDDVFDKN